MNAPTTAPPLLAWRTHNRWLGAFALLSIAGGAVTFVAARGPDGRDPFYVGLAIEFVAWGAINLVFAWRGRVDERRVRRGGETAEIEEKARRIIAALRFNRWLNALWLTTGIGLIVWGEAVGSPALCGHGLGVLAQAVALTVADEIFLARLRLGTPTS